MLVRPYGGQLVNLIVGEEDSAELIARAVRLPVIQITERSACDLELLASGAFSPLDRFVGKEDHGRILDEMRLASGAIFPIPVSLPIDQHSDIKLDGEVALHNSKNDLLAILRVEEIYEWNLAEVALRVFGTTDARHPLVAEMHRWGRFNLSGRLEVIDLPRRYDFQALRLTPAMCRSRLGEMGRTNVVAFQTRNPLHRGHEEITKRAMAEVDGNLLLHAVVGMTKPGDVDYFARVRTYQVMAERYYDPNRVLLALLPLAMRFAGPREALWHALIRRNHGANYLIVGRDHASPGADSSGKPFYEPYEAQNLVERFSDELGVGVIRFQELSYNRKTRSYQEAGEGADSISLSGTEVRERYLKEGRPLPDWFTRPEVARILEETYPLLSRRGVCIWFTGLSGAGKSKTAEILTGMLLEHGRRVTLLDGDVVRTHLSKGLRFSKEDRDTNIRRIGFVASEIVRHGGVAICAAVSPYRAARNDVRNMVGAEQFIEVFVDTPLEVCERRDPKGIYAKARRGEIHNVTGLDDPYEAPENAELTLETVSCSAEQNARLIIEVLRTAGFLTQSHEAVRENTA